MPRPSSWSMDADPPDQESLAGALSWAQARLRSWQKRQLESLEAARRSLEDALEAVLREEELRWAQAREERARLQAELTALQDANERAVQAGVTGTQALRHQLGSLHTCLLAVPAAAAAPPADIELAQEAATLLTRSAHLALKLTRAHFVPHPGPATLGGLQLEEQALCFPPPQRSPARDGARPPEGILCQEEAGARAGGTAAHLSPGRACGAHQMGLSEPWQGEEPPGEAGVAPGGEEALPGTEGAQEEEEGAQRARPAGGNIRPPSLAGRSPGRCLPTPVATLSAEAQGTLPEDPAATLFRARPVAAQEDGSERSGGEGGGGSWGEGVVLGSWAPSRRGAFPRWASVESLGRRWGAPRGVGLSLGGSCAELGPRTGEGGPLRLSSLPRGALLGEPPPAPPPTQQESSVGCREAPGFLRWPAARRPPTPAAPLPPCNQLVGQWGQLGRGQGQLCLPHGLHAAPPAGPLYVVDFGNRRLQEVGPSGRGLPLRGKAYFDVAVDRGGRLALTDSARRCVELYSPGGALLQTLSEAFGSPRGIAAAPRGEFLVADMRLGVVHVLLVGSGGQLVRGPTLRGFHKPYLVATNSRGEVAVSERGLDGGCCVKVLGADWRLLRVLGGRGSPPTLTNPWGVSLDEEGRVLVADWGRHAHTVLCYPPRGPGWAVVTEGLSSPRGVALLGKRHLVVADSMHHCLKTFRY